MLPVQRNRSIWQHGTDQRHAGTGGSNGAVAQLVARFVRIEEVGSSTLLSSTRTRSIEPYSFSRIGSRLNINSRVVNAALVFCLCSKQDFKTKDRTGASRCFRAARHTKKTSREQGKGGDDVLKYCFLINEDML